MNAKTKLYSSLKPRAVALRRKGYTFSEIATELGSIPKATLSGWLKNVELTDAHTQRIRDKMNQAGHKGRQLGAWANKQKRVQRLELLEKEARGSYGHNREHPLFIAGLVLYLAEGSKKTEIFSFMNSDSNLILFMIRWIENVSDIRFEDMRFRLYIHELYAHENCENYWQEKLGITQAQLLKTVYKPNIREYKKNPSYKGCMRLEIRGSELYWKTMFWRDCFYESMNA